MAKQSKTEKFLNSQIEAFFNKHGKDKIFGIMDLGKIHKAGRDQGPNGLPAVEAAVIEAINKYACR